MFILQLLFCAQAYAKIEVAITIDDLPRHSEAPAGTDRVEVARKMLKVLKAHGVPEAVGFVNAEKLEKDPALAEVHKLWIEAGYPLSNHAYSHKSLHDVSIEEFKADIDKNEPLLAKLNGTREHKYFRYPFLREGDTIEKRDAIRAYLKEKGYKIAQVTVDWEDWSWNTPYARCADKKDTKQIEWLQQTYLDNAVGKLIEADVIARHLFKRPIPHIVLLHIGAFDTEMLDQLLTRFEKAGAKFIPLSKAVQDKVYDFDPKIVGRWGAEFTYQVMKARGIKRSEIRAKAVDYPEEQLTKVCL